MEASHLGPPSKTCLQCSLCLFLNFLSGVNCLFLVSRYKYSPFSFEDAFGSRWETDSSWGMDKEEEPEVTVASIRPVSER